MPDTSNLSTNPKPASLATTRHSMFYSLASEVADKESLCNSLAFVPCAVYSAVGVGVSAGVAVALLTEAGGIPIAVTTLLSACFVLCAAPLQRNCLQSCAEKYLSRVNAGDTDAGDTNESHCKSYC